jgi:hypothetical protein
MEEVKEDLNKDKEEIKDRLNNSTLTQETIHRESDRIEKQFKDLIEHEGKILGKLIEVINEECDVRSEVFERINDDSDNNSNDSNDGSNGERVTPSGGQNTKGFYSNAENASSPKQSNIDFVLEKQSTEPSDLCDLDGGDS